MSPESNGQNPPKAPNWKRTFAIIGGIIGLIASSSTVVALIYGWFNPDTTDQQQQQKLDAIERKLDDKGEGENEQLVNQVSRRVTELGDQFELIKESMKDIRRLDQSLSKDVGQAILTPDQEKMNKISRKKELEELLALLSQADKSAARFIDSVKEDDTLGQVKSIESESAQRKTRALKQAGLVREKIIPELQAIRKRHSS